MILTNRVIFRTLRTYQIAKQGRLHCWPHKHCKVLLLFEGSNPCSGAMDILNESQDQQDAEFSFGAVSAKGQPPTFVDIHHKGHGQQDLRDLKPDIP